MQQHQLIKTTIKQGLSWFCRGFSIYICLTYFLMLYISLIHIDPQTIPQ